MKDSRVKSPFSRPALFLAAGLALGACLAGTGPAMAAAPAGSVATQTLRAQTGLTVMGLEQGRSTAVAITDPAKAAKVGLSGLSAGDKVTVTNAGGGKWTVSHPDSGRVVTLDQAPDL